MNCRGEKEAALAGRPSHSNLASRLLDKREVDRRLAAIAAGFDFAGQLVILVEAVDASSLNSGDVHEMVLAASLGGDETKTLRGVEELNSAISGSHLDNS